MRRDWRLSILLLSSLRRATRRYVQAASVGTTISAPERIRSRVESEKDAHMWCVLARVYPRSVASLAVSVRAGLSPRGGYDGAG